MIDNEFMNSTACQSSALKLDRHFTSGASTAGRADGLLPDNDRRFSVWPAFRLWDDIRRRWMRNPDYRPTVRGVYGRHAMAPNYPYFDGRLK